MIILPKKIWFLTQQTQKFLVATNGQSDYTYKYTVFNLTIDYFDQVTNCTS